MKFDLSANPFLALGLSTSADAREVSDAAQDAIDDGLLSEDEAVRIKQVLTTPKLRLDAELSGLLDVDRKTTQSIRTLLRADYAPGGLAPFVERLHSLPRSNLLTHSISKFGGDAAALRQLFDAQEACPVGGITEALNEAREQSSFPAVGRPAVETALRALFARQFQAAVDGFDDPERLADEIAKVTTDLVRGASVPPERLDILLTMFGQTIEAELSRRGERVRKACDAIRDGSRTDKTYGELDEAVSKWLRLTAPLQTLEESKGRDDPRTRQLYETVNGLGIWLTNEKGDNAGALKVLRIARQAFKALPRAVEQIDSNIAIVEGNVLWSYVEPLTKCIGAVTDDVRGVNADLSRGGFGTQSIGIAKELFGLFQRADNALRGTDAHPQPWIAVRGLAIDLTNEHDLPGASQKLLAGLRAYAAKNPPPDGIMEQINVDWSTTSDNVAFGTITGHMKAGRLKEAVAASEAAITATQNGDNRANFTLLRDAARKKRTSQFLKRLGWVAAGAFVLYLIAANQGTHSPRRTTGAPSYSAPSSSTATPRPVQREEITEAAPTERAGGTFSRSNIRYCRYQDARIESARTVASTDAQIDRFNALVNSYNSRCGNFLYMQSDWDVISIELLEKQSQLAKEGRSLLQ